MILIFRIIFCIKKEKKSVRLCVCYFPIFWWDSFKTHLKKIQTTRSSSFVLNFMFIINYAKL